jgi:phospholipid/cholesterol/gamma-HCH transport system substrate-binding protein
VLTRSRKNDLIVGVFVLIALGTFLYMTFLIQGTSGRNPLELRIIYPEVGGLEIGAPVLVGGFRSGRVVRMRPIEADNGRMNVEVITEVSRNIPIHNDAQIYLRQFGFIGDKRIEIDPGTRDSGRIEDGQVFVGVPFRDFMEVLASGQAIGENLNEVLINIREITGDRERLANIDRTIIHVADSSERIAAMLAENRDSVREITRNAHEVSARSVEIAAKADAILDEARRSVDEVNALIARLQEDRERAAGSVDRILANAESASGRATGLVETTEVQIRELSEEVRQAANELAELLRKVTRGEGTAGRLVADPRPFDDLQQSITALRALLVEQGPRGADHEVRFEYRQPAAAQ